MPRHVAEPDAADQAARVDRAAAKVRLALQEYLDLMRPGDDAVVLEWAAAVEWSNPEAERRNASGRLTVCEPDRISASAINGLGLFMAGMIR